MSTVSQFAGLAIATLRQQDETAHRANRQPPGFVLLPRESVEAIVIEAREVVRPHSVAESEAKRAGTATSNGTEGAASAPSAGGRSAAIAAPPSPLVDSGQPLCLLQWGADTCVLPLGHDGECEDDEGNGLEVAF